MRRFTQLFAELDASTATSVKLLALQRYFASVPAEVAPEDAAWALYFLAGGKPRQVVPTSLLRELACARAGVDDWLFEACYQAVGDLAETIAQVLPPPQQASEHSLSHWVEQRLLPLRGLTRPEQLAQLEQAFDELDGPQRFLLIKLIGGGFRVGVSKLMVQRALAQLTGLDPKLLAQRLVGWTEARQTPSARRWQALVAPPGSADAADGEGENGQASALPYPFFLAHALAAAPQTLGAVADWLVEWKYDGIRVQAVKRGGQIWLWSRGEELITERFPEVVARLAALPDGSVLDGELLAWLPGQAQPAPFALLQPRINRKTLGAKLLASSPMVLLAYDLLELGGEDLREQPQHQRRQQLENLHAQVCARESEAAVDSPAKPTVDLDAQPWRLSPLVQAESWAQLAALREQSRARGVEGFMLKQRSSAYGSGRTKRDGTWWKWKVDPLAVDAVLIYAQAGHGRRASVYTDYSFALWNRPPASAEEAQAVIEAITRREPAQPGALQLLPFAKAYSGLSDEEFKAVDRVIRATTLEKFGPVRSVRPSLVFELGFEGVQKSARHKSGVAVRFPRMLRPRPDKAVWQADSLQTLLDLA